MSDFVFQIPGGDVSKYQGPWDWGKAAEKWLFAYIRAGGAYQNTKQPFTDNRFHENADTAPDFLPVGFYWYFVPGGDPIAQADYFCDLIRDKDWKLPPMVDLEFDGGEQPFTITAEAIEFITQIYVRFPDRFDEIFKPLTYSRSNWLHDNTVDHPAWPKTELAIARYGTMEKPWGNPGETNPKLIPPYWDECTTRFWQHTESAEAVVYGGLGPPQGDDDVDLQWFNGTEDEFLLYIGADEPMPKIVKVNTIRNAVLYDGLDGRREHIIPHGLHFPVLESKEASDGRLWYRLGDGWWAVAGALEKVE